MTKAVKVNDKGEVLRPVPLRVNEETIDELRQMGKKVSYVKIGVRKYPCIIEYVTEAEYRSYIRVDWADIKAEQREMRCLIPDGNGGFIMCPECNKCCGCEKVGKWDFDNGHAVHIESIVGDSDDGEDVSTFDIKSDAVNDESEIAANQIADMIEAELVKIKPKYGVIFREMFSGNFVVKDIAKNNNLTLSTTYEDVPKVMKKAQEIFTLLMQ